MAAVAAAKTAYVIIIAYISLIDPSGYGILSGHQDFKTKAECDKAAAALDAKTLEGIILSSGTKNPAPWNTVAVCGTHKQVDEAVAVLKAHAAAQDQQPADDPREHPGGLDPYPKGG